MEYPVDRQDLSKEIIGRSFLVLALGSMVVHGSHAAVGVPYERSGPESIQYNQFCAVFRCSFRRNEVQGKGVLWL